MLPVLYLNSYSKWLLDGSPNETLHKDIVCSCGEANMYLHTGSLEKKRTTITSESVFFYLD